MTEIPPEVQAIVGERRLEDVAITVKYRNWRGEVADRKIIPLGVSFQTTDYHPVPQWLMRVYDLDKKAIRDYALADILEWKEFPKR